MKKYANKAERKLANKEGRNPAKKPSTSNAKYIGRFQIIEQTLTSNGIGTYILENEKDKGVRLTLGQVESRMMQGVNYAEAYQDGPDCKIKLVHTDGRVSTVHVKSEGSLPDWSKKPPPRKPPGHQS